MFIFVKSSILRSGWREAASTHPVHNPQCSGYKFFSLIQKVGSTVQRQSVQHLQRVNCKSLDIRIHTQNTLTCIWMTFLSLPSFLRAAQNVCRAGKPKGFPRTEQKLTIFGFLHIPLLSLCTACKNEKGVGEKSQIYDFKWSVYLSFWKTFFMEFF